MFETLRRLYDDYKLPKTNLRGAVNLKFITAEQYEEITREEY